jgi:hypothetical protein
MRRGASALKRSRDATDLEAMPDEIERAREALDAGSDDQALVLLWKAVEPARLADDNEALAAIAELAASIPGREAADLVAATGVQPPSNSTPASVAPPAADAPRGPRRSLAPGLWLVVVFLVALLVGVRSFNGLPNVDLPNASGRPAKVTIGADGLYLVPLAHYPQAELKDVGFSVIREAGAVDIRSPIGLGPTTYDAARRQFVAEELLRRLTESYGVGDGRTVLIVGVTSFEMYERARPEEARAELARSADGRYVVISTASLDESDPHVRKKQLAALVRSEVRRVGFPTPGT